METSCKHANPSVSQNISDIEAGLLTQFKDARQKYQFLVQFSQNKQENMPRDWNG